MVDNTPAKACKVRFEAATLKKLLKFGILVTLAFGLGYIHYRYVSTIHENVTHFSHLSETEREMSFYSESAFYYSFYKTLVEERPFIAGVSKLMNDQTVEYPDEVNAFNRFNIHPEVLIGSLYRYLEPWLNHTRQCHLVARGEGLEPVESCVGVGQPVMFYLEGVWWLAGLTVAALFLHATALSETVLGGLLAVAQYFANHAEATRVQWVPNQRENMAAPLLLLQAWLLSAQLRPRQRDTNVSLQVSVLILNCLCLLFWQFTQFIFLVQTAIFFVMEQLKVISTKTLCVFLHSHFCGLHMAVLILHGNDMLKSSMYASFFLVVSAYCLFFSGFRVTVKNNVDLVVETCLVLLRTCIVICASVYLKFFISDFLGVQEDNHVWDILYSKLSDYKNFHTLLYTCSKEFDFLPMSTVKNLTKTLLVPFALTSIINVCNFWIKNAFVKLKEMEDKSVKMDKDSDTEDSGIENTEIEKRTPESNEKVQFECEDGLVRFLKLLRVDAAIFFNVSQLVVYGVMAALVMRLKLLFTTQLCVVSSLVMNTKYYILPKRYTRYVPLCWALCALPLAYMLAANTAEELSYIDEYSNLPLEELLSFIRTSTSARAAFAGTLPTLAAVALSTRRAIVAHPHYEHSPARQRAYSVLKAYGRFSSHELYQELSKLKASYLIVEDVYCYGQSSSGCSLPALWDAEAPWLAARPRLCARLLSAPAQHFYPVFRNRRYAVLRLHDVSVRYMPRSFDT
ncbi:probable C-mannosyltransferase DPY19L1 [Amyelois transitella]|uniref:probable C-mannosyltransferase DPY19L1 n=1 Tax=Amyelois transitella TaxID=680683 RepID=UPI0029907634|nr:probable C-mannosyltransferase DPY19L1 [Amyelois transitella]